MVDTFPDEMNYHVGQGLPIELVKFYTSCVVFAIEHIHSCGIAYRNLRPENILLDQRGQIRLIDFAFAKSITPLNGLEEISLEQCCRATRTYTLCGLPEYLAPEAIYGTGHDHGVDHWALGIFMYELFTGKTPVSNI